MDASTPGEREGRDQADRRLRRSDDPLVALHYQLTSTRARGDLDAIVLADTSGVVVAGAGSWPVCEELAAYAPLLADGAWADATDAVSSRVELLRRDAIVIPVNVSGHDVLLCARSPKRSQAVNDQAVKDAAAAVARILTRAAA